MNRYKTLYDINIVSTFADILFVFQLQQNKKIDFTVKLILRILVFLFLDIERRNYNYVYNYTVCYDFQL